jgi:hypothetical protein
VLAVWLGLAPYTAISSPLVDGAPASNTSVASGTLSAFDTGGADDWTLSAVASLDQKFATSIDPVGLGVGAVTETLRQNAALRQVVANTTALHSVAPEGSAPAGDIATETLQSQELGPETGQAELSNLNHARGNSPSDRKRAADSGRNDPHAPGSIDLEEVTLDDQPDGERLRQMLHSIVSRRHDEPNSAAQAINDTAADEPDSDDDVDLGDRVLDSRTLGEALNAFVQPIVTVNGTKGFSILGQGQFELDTSSDLHDVSVSELSSGISLTMPLQDGNQPRQPAHKGNERVDFLLIALNFVSTPTGTLMAITVGILVLVWGMSRVALAIRR